MMSSSLRVFVFLRLRAHFVCRLAWKWSGTGLLDCLRAWVGLFFSFPYVYCFIKYG